MDTVALLTARNGTCAGSRWTTATSTLPAAVHAATREIARVHRE